MDKDDTSKQKSKPQSLCGNVFDKVKKIVTNITIEPATFVISFANSLDNVSVQQLQIYKSCRNDFGFNETVCNNLVEDFPDENKLVQDEIAQFNVYQEMVISIFPVFFAFYLGAWCDIFGRKFIMFIFFGAKILGQVILVALAYYIELPKEWYLITLVPTSLAGGYAAFSMSLIAFIADISKPDERAFRMGMIFFSQSLGRPLATPLGAYLLQEGGYICVIASSLVGLVLGLVFLYLRMRSFKWKPVSKSETESTRSAFSLHHIKDAFIVTFKKRPGPNRKYLFTLIIMSMLQVIPWYGEMCIAFLYVRTRFGWGVTEYSTYSSIVSAASIVGQAIIIPLLKIVQARDSLVCVVVLISVVARHTIKAFSSEGWIFYLAAFVDLIGYYSSSIIRAMLTCCVPLNEFGKIFSVLSALDNILPIGLTQVYATLWAATSDTFPGAGFLLSAGISFVSLLIGTYIHISLRGKKFSEVVHPTETPESRIDLYKLPPFYEEARITPI